MSKDVSGFGHMVLVTNKSSVAIIIAYLFSLAYFYSSLNWITEYEIEKYLYYSILIIKIWFSKINFQN